MNNKEKLKKLSKFLHDNDITIVKSAPEGLSVHSNKICISILCEDNSFDDYIFEEDITSDKIKEKLK